MIIDELNLPVSGIWITQALCSCASVKWDVKGIPTAAVTIQNGKPILSINTEFWSSLTESEKLFVIDHEMMHILLDHHERFAEEVRSLGTETVNIACDFAINSILLKKYDKKDLPLIWKHMCFPEKEGLPPNKSADWYMSIVNYGIKLNSQGKQKIGNDVEKIGKFLGEEASEAKEAGKEAGKDCDLPEVENAIRKKDFSSFLKEVTRSGKVLSQGFGIEEKWGWKDRRSIDTNLAMPGHRWAYINTKLKKNRLLIYCDVSGSCTEYSKWFVSAIKCIPDRFFDKDVYYFDTAISKQFMNGGGTSFSIFTEHYKNLGYKPDLVFVLTDGQGSPFHCPNPKDWFWFLTPHSTLAYIDKQSKALALGDYATI